MYAIVETGGKQYRVEKGAKLHVEKLDVEPGNEVTLDKILMLGGEECKIGVPYISGASIRAEVLAQDRGKKVLVFKRRRRKDSKSLHGHRQDYTYLLIKDIIIE